MIIPISLGLFAICVCNYIYSLLAYDEKYQSKPVLAYLLACLAAGISITTWMWIVRHYRDPNTIMVVNVIWDVGGTVILILWPLILFDFKIDTKTIVGCVIAIIGIIIAKV